MIDQVMIRRGLSTDQGRRGLLTVSFAPFRCNTLELPWRDNRPNMSCFPAGTYELRWARPSHAIGGFRELYLIDGVPGRSGCFLHSGTVAGDRALGYLSDSYGCPLLGLTVGTYGGQLALFNSRAAVRQFNELLRGRPAQLIVEE